MLNVGHRQTIKRRRPGTSLTAIAWTFYQKYLVLKRTLVLDNDPLYIKKLPHLDYTPTTVNQERHRNRRLERRSYVSSRYKHLFDAHVDYQLVEFDTSDGHLI